MSELDADARALLDLGRDHLGPDAATIARMRGKIETAVVVAGTTTVGATIASKLISAKLVIVAVAVTTVSTVAVVKVVHHARQRDAVSAVPLPSPAVQRPIVVTPLPAAPPVVVDEPVVVTIDPPAPKPVAAAPAPKPVPKRASLARETELVDLATRAMRANDLATLQATLLLYATEAGDAGQLAEEIAAIEVEALCKANDPTAPRRLDAFFARWPNAGKRQRETLTDACTKGSP